MYTANIAFRRLASGILFSVTLTHAMDAQTNADTRPERLFYMTGSEASFESFRRNIDEIDVVGPQVFSVKGDGFVWGEVDPRVLALAKERGVKVMPLIHNPGFDQEMIHTLLTTPEARNRTVQSMVELADEHGFWGWQFDFENIHMDHRDLLTEFYRETARALHAKGYTLSIAVVPADGTPGPTSFHRYMRANWRGSFDLKALAEIGDFISYMTYAQHGTVSPPGPIAGLPWMQTVLDHALAEGVPPEKISLGIPTYSGYWYASHDDEQGARVAGQEVSYERAMSLIERAGAELHWLPDQGVHYAFLDHSGTFEWIFLENRRTFWTKLDLFDANAGLRGISVWVLGAEDPGIWGVVKERMGRQP